MKLFRTPLFTVVVGVVAALVAPTAAGQPPPTTSTTVATAAVATAAAQTTAATIIGTVYLTFDDGPHPTYTPQVLAVLKKYGVRAVFFEIGQNISYYPSVTRTLRSNGMLIGNHTWSHADLTRLSTSSVISQLNRMEGQLGYRPRCVRPPHGATNSRIATIIAGRSQRQILWTVDPRDWSRPGTGIIVNRVLAQVQPGARILLHDGGGNRSQTVAALDQLIPKLRARGYAIGLMAC